MPKSVELLCGGVAMKKLLIVLFVLLLAFGAGCSKKEKYKEYTYEELTFKLPESQIVQKDDLEGYDFVYDNQEIAIFGIKETKESLVTLGYEGIKLEEYADLLISLYSVEMINKEVSKDHVVFSYITGTESGDFYYTIGIYENANDFWIVNYACGVEDRAKYEPLFKEWAKLVTVK